MLQTPDRSAIAQALGEVPEWSIGAVSKTVERASVPRVRIPLSPPAMSIRPYVASTPRAPWNDAGVNPIILYGDRS
jgi:hypothetical protein